MFLRLKTLTYNEVKEIIPNVQEEKENDSLPHQRIKFFLKIKSRYDIVQVNFETHTNSYEFRTKQGKYKNFK